MAAILDTSCVYALMDADDDGHRRTLKAVEAFDETLLLPDVVLPEVSYLVNKYLGVEAEIKLLAGIEDGELALETFLPQDVSRVAQLIAGYSDSRIGFVDGAIVAMAERLGVTKVFTLDKHFRMIRPRHAVGFEVLP